MSTHRRPTRSVRRPASRLAVLLAVAGLTMLAIGLGFGIAPASALSAPDRVTPSVGFHDPDCDDAHAGWTGYVDGVADRAGDGVTFRVTDGHVAAGATVTITARAQAGYDFPGGNTTRSFTHTFTEAPEDCGSGTVEVTPTVRFHDPVGAGDTASWAGYVDGVADGPDDGVTFAVTSGTVAAGATVTVTATAESGYEFCGGATTKTFTHTFSDGSAGTTQVTPTVRFHNPTGADDTARWTGYVDGVADSAEDGVAFAVTSGTVAPGHTVTITATAASGYVFPGGVTTEDFTHTFTSSTAGDTRVTVAVKFVGGHRHHPRWIGLVNGAPDTPDDGVAFAVTSGSVGMGHTVTVTATAAPGYVLQGGVTSLAFTHTFAAAGSGQGGQGGSQGGGHGASGHHGAGAGTEAGAGAGAGAGSGAGGAGVTAESSAGLVAGRSVVPTSVAAGLPGDAAAGRERALAATLFAGGLLLLAASGLVARRQQPGAHRA